MKIIFLLNSYYEQICGGSEYQAYLLAEEAVQKGHEVHYVYISTGKPFTKTLDIHLHPIREKKLTKRLGSNKFLYYFSIMRKLREIEPDVIYQRTGLPMLGIVARYANMHQCKVIWHIACQNNVVRKQSGTWRHRLFNHLDQKMFEYGVRNATYIVGQANYQAVLLKENYGRECNLVVGNFHPAPREEIEKSGEIQVVWIANLKPMKNPDIFIRLAEEFQTVPKVRFIMIGREGNGRWYAEVQKRMANLDNFEYLREQPIEQVNKVLAKSHVFVNTSDFEGFPNTFVQAWMRKVPVVSLHVDPDNVLVREEIGFHSRTYERMVADVRRLVENTEECEEMGERAQMYAFDNHSCEKNISKIFKLVGF